MLESNLPETLDAIGRRHSTDKSSLHHNFLGFYERFFERFRYSTDVRVLEIGVYDGGSLRTWEEYFPHARVIGMDITPEAAVHSSDRIKVEIADGSDIITLSRIVRQYGPFDVIVDDGSHWWHHQIASFRYLYAAVKPGGHYVMEDIDTSFGDFIKDYKRIEGMSPTAYMHLFCDYMVGDRVMDLATQPDEFIRSYVPVTESISYYPRTCLISRKSETAAD